MSIPNRKRKIADKTVRIIFCAVTYAFLALFIGGLFAFSGNYNKIYSSPQVNGGEADFAQTDIPTRDVACNLAGEWEFFYNEWIVTDNVERQPDGMIKLPDVWTYKNYGSGALPRSGYASYRLVAENVQKGINVIVYRHYGNFAYRVFINGQLNYRSGTLFKNADETVITGSTDERHPYLTDGSPLEIIIEVSANRTGGFNAAPWLAATSTGTSYGTNLRSFNYIAIGITTAAVAISMLTFIFFKYKRDITVPAFMLALYAHFLASRDLFYVLHLQITAALFIELFSAIAAFVLLIMHFKRSGASFKKVPLILSAITAVVCTVLLPVFYGTPLAPVFGFALLAIGCSYLVPVVFNNKIAPLQRGVYGALFAFLTSIFFFEMCDGLGLLVFGTEFIFSFELMLIIACFAVLWLWKLAKDARNAIRVSELECELHSVKNQALKAQIKPHFIYNSLTAIQSRYRDGLQEGDRAIEQFAKHLRLITDSNGEDLIPFEDEVRNVLNYFELENLRAGGELNLLLDLNYTDFAVPVLSLQPLVENSIRHGKLRERLGGFVQLCSERESGFIIVTVSDNGAGFNVNAVREGVGIENTRKRFELLNAEMSISSGVQGTRVTIKIPLG